MTDSEAVLSLVITQSTNDEGPDEDGYDDDDVQKRIVARQVLLGFIIPIGLIFNTVAFVVFLKSPGLRRTTTARYLIALTIADSTFLVGEFIKWLNETGPVNGPIFSATFAETNLGWCTVMYFLRYYGKFVSVWLTVAITVERYIGIALPLRVSTISTKKITTFVIVAIYVIGACLTAFPFWIMKIVHTEVWGTFCTYKDRDVYHRWNWAVIRVGTLILPCALIFIFTGMIIYNLRKITSARQEMTITVNDSATVEKQLTFMLVSVAIATLVLRLPYTVVYPIYDYRHDIWGSDFRGTWPEFRLFIIRDIAYVIATTNYTINFFLFCLTGSVFRKNLKRCLLCKGRKRSPRGQYTRATVGTSLHSSSNSPNISMHRINHAGISPKSTPKLLHVEDK